MSTTLESSATALRVLAGAGDDAAILELSRRAHAYDHLLDTLPTGQDLRVAAAACNAAASVRRVIGSFTRDDEPDRVTHEALTLEQTAAQLAALAETLDGNR